MYLPVTLQRRKDREMTDENGADRDTEGHLLLVVICHLMLLLLQQLIPQLSAAPIAKTRFLKIFH